MLTLDAWWAALEQDLVRREPGEPPGVLEGASTWQHTLAHAAGVEVGATRPDQAAAMLESVRSVLDDSWQPTWRWLNLQTQLRARSLAPAEGRAALLTLAEEAAGTAVRCRSLHLAGVTALWTGEMALAETLLARALGESPGPVRRAWILDSIGQALLWQGAWLEARRVFDGVIAAKSELDDAVGTAITIGHRALLELGLGEGEAAARLCARHLAVLGPRLPDRTRLRLTTMHVQGWLDAAQPQPARQAAAELEGLLERVDHPLLTGFASLALARVHQDDPTRCAAWLDEASMRLSGPQRELVDYWRLALGLSPYHPQPPPADPPARVERTEARLRMALLHAQRVTVAEQRRGWLRWAMELATRANQLLWSAEVDQLYQRLEPLEWGQRVVERYAGVGAETLDETSLEEVTIIFSDLVGFTSRSQVLSPHEVIDTVRSLFELTAPLLTRHRVRPLQHLGDGLLSVAQGDGHRERGLAFAQDLTERTRRISQVRYAMGEALGLEVRAGVASGPVVLGRLGSLSKLEYLAIGRTTNLAARLQGVADPLQVVADRRGEPRQDWEVGAEDVRLKGFTEAVEVYRYRRVEPKTAERA